MRTHDEIDAGVSDLALLIELIVWAAETLEASKGTLANLHGLLAGSNSDTGTTPDVIDAAEDATAAATQFADSLVASAGALATFLGNVETAARETTGAEGLPAATTEMDSGRSAFAGASSAAAETVTEQGEALGEKALPHVLQQVDGAALSCSTAARLALNKMNGLRDTAEELISGLTETHGGLADSARYAAVDAAEQAGEIPNGAQVAASVIGDGCRAAAAAFGARCEALEAAFTQRREELEAEATRLESGVSALLSARTAEAGSADEALSEPVNTAIETAVHPSVEELERWRDSLQMVLEAAAGLDALAGQLARAREVMTVSNAALQEMGQG